MPDVFLARQPIHDRAVNAIGYEILYRVFEDSKAPPIDDPDQATAQVILNTFIEIDLAKVVGKRKRAFFNMTSRFLTDQCYLSLPREHVVLEVPAEVAADEGLSTAVRRASDVGYKVSLDNYTPSAPADRLLQTADYVKIDVGPLDADGMKRAIAGLGQVPAVPIAHRVETREQFDQAVEAGFRGFQGFFFCEPEVVTQRAVPVDRTSLLRLLSEIQDPNVKIERVTEIVERDVSFTYRLLRLVNSAMYGFRREIESIRHAIAMIGLERVRSLVSLILLASVDDKPHELMQTALVRARFCRYIAEAIRNQKEDVWFSIGLLSVLDAIADRPMSQVLSDLSLSEEVRIALLSRKGPGGEVLSAAVHCERGEFAHPDVMKYGRTVSQGAYLAAIQWASQLDEEIAQSR